MSCGDTNITNDQIYSNQILCLNFYIFFVLFVLVSSSNVYFLFVEKIYVHMKLTHVFLNTKTRFKKCKTYMVFNITKAENCKYNYWLIKLRTTAEYCSFNILQNGKHWKIYHFFAR